MDRVKKKLYSTLLLAFFTVTVSHGYTLDCNNVHEVTRRLINNFLYIKRLTCPFAAHFKNDNNELLYIASYHQADKNSQTFHMVKQAIEVFKPDFIVLEGFTKDQGISPSYLKELFNKEMILRGTYSEVVYAIYLATKNSIDFMGTEPSQDDFLKILKISGYTAKDLDLFIFSRTLFQFKNQGQLRTEADIPGLLEECYASFNLMSSSYSYDEYRAWLHEKLGRNVSFQDLEDPLLCDVFLRNTYLQQLSAKHIFIRDVCALEVIMESLSKHKKVLVVFGAAHYITQKDVLVENLGQPFYMSSEQFIHVCRSANNKQ